MSSGDPNTPSKGFPAGAPGPKTPGTIADEFSKLDFPAPSAFAFSKPKTSSSNIPTSVNVSGKGGEVPEHGRPDDLTEKLSSLQLPEPEQLASAREHRRKESVSEQLSAQLSQMRLPEPERIFGGQGVHEDGTAVGVSGGGVKPEEWYRLKLGENEVPEAVRKGTTEGITSPVTSPVVGEGASSSGRFDGRGMSGAATSHTKGQPSLSSLMEAEEAKGTGPIQQKDIAAAAAPGGSTAASAAAPSVMSSVVNAAKTAASSIAGAVGAESTAKALKPDAAAPKEPVKHAQVITPWDVQGEVTEDGRVLEVDYTKLIAQFGTKAITPDLLERFEKLTGRKPHRLLRRGTFFSHRDLNVILDRYEQKKPFYLYTGRGPSSNSMHMGHQIPFMFTAWLQDVFDCPLVIQITDDEKFLFKPSLKLEEVHKFAYENIKDIIACGVKLEKTFIFSDLDYVGKEFYWNVVRIARSIPSSQSKAAFGFTDTDNVGKLHFVAVQAAPSFSNSFPQIFGSDSSCPCLIPCAIDQDPYFRLTRDVAAKLKYPKPSLIHCKFLPALQGAQTKMSASDPNSAIYMADTPNQIKNKITRHAFSGGGDTLELHQKNGGNPDVDVAFQYLSFFEEDDEKLAKVAADYRAGTLMTGQLKALCIKALQDEVKAFQERKAAITLDVFHSFMDSTRKIDPTPSPRRT